MTSVARSTEKELDAFWSAVRRNERDYIENMQRVINKAGDKVNFELNAQQNVLETKYEECQRNYKPIRWAIVKYRQPGITKYMGVKTHTRLVSREHHTAIITAHRKPRAEKTLRLQKAHLKNIPQKMRPVIGKDNKEELYLEDRDSEIYCLSANDPEAIRGDTVHTWVCTEPAYYGEKGASLTQLFDSGINCVPELPDTMAAFETTANGTGDEYYGFYNNCEDFGFEKIFLDFAIDPECDRPFHGRPQDAPGCYWYDHPEAETWQEAQGIRRGCRECNKKSWDWAKLFMTEDLRDRQKKYGYTMTQMHWYWWRLNKLRKDRLKMRQEYPSNDKEAFIASGTLLFDAELVEKVKSYCTSGRLYDLPYEEFSSLEDLVENDTLVRNKTPYLEVWEDRKPQLNYVVTADSSHGDEKSHPSAAYICEQSEMRVVAAIHGRIDPALYGIYLDRIGRYYNNAIMAPEKEQTGYAVLQALELSDYPNMYQRYKLTPQGWIETPQLGWSTSAQTKPLMVAAGTKVFNLNNTKPKHIAWMIRDPQLCDELSRFTDGAARGQVKVTEWGAHFDRCIAWFINLMVCHQEQGIDVEDWTTADMRDAQDYEGEKLHEKKKIIKARAMPFKEHLRQRKYFEMGYSSMDEVPELILLADDDYDMDNY